MFCLANLDRPNWINLKCDPELAAELRERHNEVTPGYHMNKKYWNTIALDGTLSDKLILSWIDHSYELVVEGLPKKERNKL